MSQSKSSVTRYNLDIYSTNKYGEWETIADMKASEHGKYVEHSSFVELQEKYKKAVETLKIIAFKSEFVASYQYELRLSREQAEETLKELGEL